MRKILLTGMVATLALSGAAATSAMAGGNGAARSGLSPQAGDSSNNDQCIEGSGSGANGFAIVNAPGKPGEARFVNGEVSLKRGDANTVYNVLLRNGQNDCMIVGMLATNGVGNGNFHLNDATMGGGTFYVVLQLGTTEKYATKRVTVN